MKIITFGLQQWRFLGSLPVESHAGLSHVCLEGIVPGWWGWNERKQKIVDAIKENVSKSLDQLNFLQFMGMFNTSTIMSTQRQMNLSIFVA